MLHNEQILTFSEAAKRLPKISGKRLHASTIWRWARRGIAGIRLETRRIGARFVTSLEALDRFTAELAQVDPERWTPTKAAIRPKGRTQAQRERDVRQAQRELERDGI